MIYLILFILLLILTIRFDFGQRQIGRVFWYNATLVILILVSGLRYKVGGDTFVYLNYYSTVPNLTNLTYHFFAESIYNPFWVILCSLSKSISSEFIFFQLLQACVVNTIIFRFIKQNTRYYFTAVLVYFVFLYVYFNMEIMRESLAVCVFLLAYPSYKEKKWRTYYFFAIIAYLFHSSALLVFIFPLFRNLKFNIVNICLVLLLSIALFFLFLSYPELLRVLLFSDTISNKFDIYSNMHANINGRLYTLFFYGLLPLVVLLLNKKSLMMKGLFKELYLIYFFLVFVYATSYGFSRFLNYLSPFMMIYFANFLHDFYNRKRFAKFKTGLLVVIVSLAITPKILYYFEDTSDLVAGTHKYNLWYPYSSVFNEEDFRYRELLFYSNFGRE